MSALISLLNLCVKLALKESNVFEIAIKTDDASKQQCDITITLFVQSIQTLAGIVKC